MSIISTGTTFGIMVAGLTALAVAVWGMPWRAAWLVLALSALAAAVYNVWLLPSGPHVSNGRGAMRRLGWNWLVRAGSAPLFAVALSFGVANAIYWQFMVDLLFLSGEFYGLSRAAGSVFYAVLGVLGFTGLLIGDAVARFGLRRILVAIQASLGISVGLLGLAPASLLAVGVSAVFFGIGVMTMSALLSVWSSAVFSEQPSTGFSATLFVFAGPVAAGVFAGEFGLDTAFLSTGVLALLTALVRPTGELLSAVVAKQPSAGRACGRPRLRLVESRWSVRAGRWPGGGS